MHGHEHHHHARGASPLNERALLWALGLNAAYLVVEAAAGWITGSLALLSDAAHMLSDVAALTIAYGAARLATFGADRARTFGWRRAEPLGAFTNALGLAVACMFIVGEAINRLVSEPREVAGLPVLIVASIGLAINLGSAWLLARGDRDNLNIRGALLHMLADALGSVGAMVAGVAVMYGAHWADAAVSIGIALLVLWSAWSLVRDSGRVLLEMAPPGVDTKAIQDAICALPGVADVHDLHVWSLDGQYTLLTAHIVVDPGIETEPVRVASEQVLKRDFAIGHHTLQLERAAPCQPPSATCAPRPVVDEQHRQR